MKPPDRRDNVFKTVLKECPVIEIRTVLFAEVQ